MSEIQTVDTEGRRNKLRGKVHQYLSAMAFALSITMFAAPPLFAESGAERPAPADGIAMGASGAQPATMIPPLSRVALGVGVSPLGINLAAATNLNRYLNLRGTGNAFHYTANNINTDGVEGSAKLDFASAGISLDFYPFPRHGLRISPGVLFYNKNAVSAVITQTGGTSFKLNGNTYYTSATNPVTGTAGIGLNSRNPAFTITTGWGNMIPRRGGHLSFPFEVGIALVGSPSVNAALVSGQVCNSSGTNCQNVATDQTLQADLQAQVAKWKSDLNVVQFYPIVSFGVAFNFKIR